MYTIQEQYDTIPDYDMVEIKFYRGSCEVGAIIIKRDNVLSRGIGTAFEDVKIGLEKIISNVAKEERKMEISNKIRQMKELQDFFTNLSPEDMELMR